ncbi:lactonase family protein [Microbacterium sp. JZ31]|uniref:lactonase family protein n=1 Tax=Microbacterium sp. JZ31 TaxID=1906274 RepID=UPI00300D60CE
MRIWIGARGADMGKEARGVMAATAGAADSPLASGPLTMLGDAVEAPSPTWLAAHPSLDVVYAALEGEGCVAAFRRTGEATLAPLGPTVDAGETTCHIAVAPDGSHLVAAAWGDGVVTHVALGPDGRLGARTEAEPAADPYATAAAPAPDAATLVAEQGGVADLRALVDRGADASQLAAMLAGSTPTPAIRDDAGLDEILSLLGQSRNPFDDPAVRDILRPGPRPLPPRRSRGRSTSAGPPLRRRMSRARRAHTAARSFRADSWPRPTWATTSCASGGRRRAA